jgi:hypothetical protein
VANRRGVADTAIENEEIRLVFSLSLVVEWHFHTVSQAYDLAKPVDHLGRWLSQSILSSRIGGVAMKTSALIPLVFLAMAHSAGAVEFPYQNRPTEPPVSHFKGTCEVDADGTKFAEKACRTTYYPGDAKKGSAYRPPVCEKDPVSKDQKEVLAKIYSRSPDYLKARLCRLTQLFVTDSSPWGPVGWGFWEGPDRPPGTGVYLAISARELDGKKSIADGENETVDQLLGVTDGNRRGLRLARLRDDGASDQVLTILAEVSHEMGHVLLADANMDGTNRFHPRRKVSGPPRSACFEDAFLGASWSARKFHKNMRRWVDFGNQYHNSLTNPDVRFSLERLRAATRSRKVDSINQAIKNVYDSKEFVSFAASINPWEDVAETYKYRVLADATPNKKVEFRLTDQSINVSDSLESKVLAKKMQCLRDFGFLSDLP